MSTVKLVSTEAALGVLGTSRFTSTQSLGWNGLSTESTLLPLVSASLGGEPAYPISELKMNIYIYIRTREGFGVFRFGKFRKSRPNRAPIYYTRLLANACRVSRRPPSYNSSGDVAGISPRSPPLPPFMPNFLLTSLLAKRGATRGEYRGKWWNPID